MKAILVSIVLLLSMSAFALDSSITLSRDEALKNETVGRSGDINVAGARIIQLQLRGMECGRTTVVSNSLDNDAESFTFSISSENCIVMDKNGPTCAAGYSAKNMPANPLVAGSVVLGDKYKVCIKSSAPAAQGAGGGRPGLK